MHVFKCFNSVVCKISPQLCGARFKQHFLVVFFDMLYKVVLVFESVKTILTSSPQAGPRSGMSGREKWWPQFSRTDERALGMLLSKNQFHISFTCLSLIGHKKILGCAQAEASIYRAAFVIFLYQEIRS